MRAHSTALTSSFRTDDRRPARVGLALLAVAAHLGLAAWALHPRESPQRLSATTEANTGSGRAPATDGQLVWVHLSSGGIPHPAARGPSISSTPAVQGSGLPQAAPVHDLTRPCAAQVERSVGDASKATLIGPTAHDSSGAASRKPVADGAGGGPSPGGARTGAETPAPEVGSPASGPAVANVDGPVDLQARAAAGNALPDYPDAAREDGQEGTVRLLVDVDAQGRVLQVHWLERSGVMVLDVAAREAVRRWHFLPARRAGILVAGQVRLSLRFELEGGVRWIARAGDDPAAFRAVPH